MDLIGRGAWDELRDRADGGDEIAAQWLALVVTELLLQRTLSLYQEAQRYPDYRRFGRLASLGTLPQDVAQTFTVATASTLPNQECDSRARAGNPGGIPMSCPGGAAIP